MNKLRQALQKLDRNNNPEDRVIYQVVDLLAIKSKGVEQSVMDEEIILTIDALILDWMWLYSAGYSMSMNPKESMSADDLERYNAMTNRFSSFQQFMQHNMDLVD